MKCWEMWQLQQEKENQTNANYVDQIISKNLKTWPIKQNEKKKNTVGPKNHIILVTWISSFITSPFPTT